MTPRSTSRLAVVTGCSQGLGAALASELLERGFIVVATVRPGTGGLPCLPELDVVELDVTDDEQIGKAASHVGARYGRVDLLVCNVGVSGRTVGGDPASATSLGRLQRATLMRMMEINAVSALLIAQAFRPLLQDPSTIVNISSDRSEMNQPDVVGNYGYRSSKAALNLITEALASELPEHVQVLALHPGGFFSPINSHGPQTPVEAARRVLQKVLDRKMSAGRGGYVNLDTDV